jgi:hypothetical protein
LKHCQAQGSCNWSCSKYSAKIGGLDQPFIVARQARRRVKAPRDPSLQSAALGLLRDPLVYGSRENIQIGTYEEGIA